MLWTLVQTPGHDSVRSQSGVVNVAMCFVSGRVEEAELELEVGR